MPFDARRSFLLIFNTHTAAGKLQQVCYFLQCCPLGQGDFTEMPFIGNSHLSIYKNRAAEQMIFRPMHGILQDLFWYTACHS